MPSHPDARTAPLLLQRLSGLAMRRLGRPRAIIANLMLLVVLWICFTPLWRWAVTTAVWSGSREACRKAGSGACWVYVQEKLQFFLFGFYPAELQWRPIVATLLLLLLAGVSVVPRLWRTGLVVAWALGVVAVWWLMGGGLGLTPVTTNSWGGLPVTVMLAVFALVFGFPLGVLLALGRTSELPLVRYAAIGWIEAIRGVPFISILFMANVLLPFLAPGGFEIDKLARVQVAFVFFASAYLAEVVRGGLQTIPKGQREAAAALGLGYWTSMILVVLPQALRVVVPPLVNTAIAFFKDTSLIIVIGLFDLLGTVRAASKDPAWLGHAVEGYLAAALIYFVFCFGMSRIGSRLEKSGAQMKRF